MKRRFASTVFTGMYVLVLTMIAVVLNVVVAQMPPVRLDLTSSGQYSLSETTRNVLGRLDDRIKVEAYFTKELPAPYNRHAAYLHDLLEEYAVFSKGNLDFEFIDPGTEESRKREMLMKGIYPVQIQEVRNDQIGIKQGFMGVVVKYGTKRESIPVVREIQNLEYELTSIIRKLTVSDLKTVAFAAGHGEASLNEKMQRVRAELEKNYKTTAHDFKTAAEIPAGIHCMVVVGPTEKWPEEHIFQLDQFIMRGGTAAFLLDNIKVDIQQLLNAQDLDHGLYDILSSYGITPEKNLVVDPQCNRINVESQQGAFRIRNVVNYPYFPSVTDLNRDHILTREIGALAFPFLSSLSVASSRPNLTYTVLARTSDKSWVEKGNYQVSPFERKARAGNAVAGPFNAVAIATGKFPSYFADKAKEGAPEYIKDPSKVLRESQETRILVVGDGSMALDEFGDQNDAVFLVNAIDWLAQDSDMIKIRNRGLLDQPLPELGSATRQTLRYANMIGIPLVFILFGLIRWQWRKAMLRNFKL